jgi:hypothetical protein
MRHRLLALLLGFFALTFGMQTPQATAQKFRLAWRNNQTGATLHDRYWTDNISALLAREAAINFNSTTVWAWVEKRRSLLGIVPLSPTAKIVKPEKKSGRLR